MSGSLLLVRVAVDSSFCDRGSRLAACSVFLRHAPSGQGERNVTAGRVWRHRRRRTSPAAGVRHRRHDHVL